MVTSEKEMVRRLTDTPEKPRETVLQPTYEDTVPPDPDEDWEFDQD